MPAPWTAASHDPLLKALAGLFTPQVYLVGGSVRDLCLGITPADYDLVTFGDVWELAATIAETLGAHVFWMDQGRGIARIAGGDPAVKIDVCAPKDSTIEGDLRRRDITVNAMAWHPATQALIDPLSGRADLKDRRIRMITEANLADDPLRCLRCLRFAVQLGATLTDATAAAVTRHAPDLARVAPERIRQELAATLSLPGGARIFEPLHAHGFNLFPYEDIPQGRHHRWPLLIHVILASLEIEKLLPDREDYLPGIGAYFEEPIEDGLTRGALLKLAVFLHDIGKPATLSEAPDGNLHFYGHPQTGAQQTGRILKDLRFSTQAVQIATGLVTQHMRVLELAVNGAITNRAMHRFLKDTAGFTPEVLLCTIADAEATGKDPAYTGARPDIEAAVRRIWQYYREVYTVTRTAPLLSGRDIMQALGLPAGPQIGRYLEMVAEARAENLIATPAQALQFLKRKAGRA